MHLPIGTLLQGGKYKILRYISSGGFGCTYEAKYEEMDSIVAIKEFFVKDFCNRDNSGAISVATQNKVELVGRLKKKFIEEAQALFKMHHHNIVRVTDKFEENNTAYYVMDYIDGKPLSALIDEKGRLGEEEALGYIRQTASALEFVHKHNRLHLDVKPQNIMIDREGKAVLIDFGVSKQYDEVNGENTSTLLGYTPGYAPIEQSGSGVTEFTPATDIYSLGATLYKALTGATPVPAHQRASSKKLKELHFPENVACSTVSAVEHSMQLYVENRPQSIAEFLELLKDLKVSKVSKVSKDSKDLNEETIAPKDSKDPKDPKDPKETIDPKDLKVSKDPKNKKIAAFIIAVLLLLGGGVIFLVTGNGGETPDIIPESSPASVVNTDSIVAARLQAYQDSIADAQRQREEEERIAREAEINAFKNRTFTVNGVSFKMVAVGGGTFQMGATSEQQNTADDERPVHSVTLSDYYIGETEVTQALWQAVMGSNPSSFTGNSQRPVESVSWNDCQTFVNNLNDLLAGQLPGGRRFRLPTEAEWEYAARGGNRSRGTQYSGSSSIGDVAWYCDNSGSITHTVKGKIHNELGLYDMSGNVLEWCNDLYSSDYYSNSPRNNPQGPSSGSCRVLRGGCWYAGAQYCRVAYRPDSSPDIRSYNYGLRLAL